MQKENILISFAAGSSTHHSPCQQNALQSWGGRRSGSLDSWNIVEDHWQGNWTALENCKKILVVNLYEFVTVFTLSFRTFSSSCAILVILQPIQCYQSPSTAFSTLSSSDLNWCWSGHYSLCRHSCVSSRDSHCPQSMLWKLFPEEHSVGRDSISDNKRSIYFWHFIIALQRTEHSLDKHGFIGGSIPSSFYGLLCPWALPIPHL